MIEMTIALIKKDLWSDRKVLDVSVGSLAAL
jgi:hypothetical protein